MKTDAFILSLTFLDHFRRLLCPISKPNIFATTFDLCRIKMGIKVFLLSRNVKHKTNYKSNANVIMVEDLHYLSILLFLHSCLANFSSLLRRDCSKYTMMYSV